MKILYRYLTREFFLVFGMSLGVLTFVMLLENMLDLFDLLIGKGLAPIIVGQVIILSLPFMVALTLPMAVLVAVLIVTSRLASDNELIAIKSSGIGISQLIRPFLVVTIGLCMLMLWFNHIVLPNSNYAFKNLAMDIGRKKPIAKIKPGIFNELGDFALYIEEKDDQTGELFNVAIYQNEGPNRTNVILARKGKLQFLENNTALRIFLEDGEMHQMDEQHHEVYNVIYFDQHTKILPGIGGELERKAVSKKRDREMRSSEMQEVIDQNNHQIATIQNRRKEIAKQWQDFSQNRLGQVKKLEQVSEFRRIHAQLERTMYEERGLIRSNNKLWVEIHKRNAIAVACIIFVLVGLPLGMMARDGGAGIGFGISLFFFLVYYVFLVGGEEFADRGFISPFWAMWAANVFFGVLGFYLLWLQKQELRIIHFAHFKEVLKKCLIFSKKKL